jgi:hypothetical protein
MSRRDVLPCAYPENLESRLRLIGLGIQLKLSIQIPVKSLRHISLRADNFREGYLKKVSAELKEYIGASAHRRITEENHIITDL